MSLRRYTVSIGDRSFTIDVLETAADRFEVSVEGDVFEATLVAEGDLPGAAISPELPVPADRQPVSHVEAPPPSLPEAARPVPGTPAGAVAAVRAPVRGARTRSAGVIAAPIPGVVLEVVVAPGARVGRGDPLLVLEAMKMRNTIRSPREAVVVEVAVAVGQPVGPGDLLVRLGDASP
jgi:glutaconyl-CoA/methylmalonyl-CoA decarboxylase subunit gamma